MADYFETHVAISTLGAGDTLEHASIRGIVRYEPRVSSSSGMEGGDGFVHIVLDCVSERGLRGSEATRFSSIEIKFSSLWKQQLLDVWKVAPSKEIRIYGKGVAVTNVAQSDTHTAQNPLEIKVDCSTISSQVSYMVSPENFETYRSDPEGLSPVGAVALRQAITGGGLPAAFNYITCMSDLSKSWRRQLRKDIDLYAYVNCMGLPEQTRGNDLKVSMSIALPTSNIFSGTLLENEHRSGTVSCNIFVPREDAYSFLPFFTARGDIIRLHRVSVSEWENKLQITFNTKRKVGYVMIYDDNSTEGNGKGENGCNQPVNFDIVERIRQFFQTMPPVEYYSIDGGIRLSFIASHEFFHFSTRALVLEIFPVGQPGVIHGDRYSLEKYNVPSDAKLIILLQDGTGLSGHGTVFNKFNEGFSQFNGGIVPVLFRDQTFSDHIIKVARKRINVCQTYQARLYRNNPPPNFNLKFFCAEFKNLKREQDHSVYFEGSSRFHFLSYGADNISTNVLIDALLSTEEKQVEEIVPAEENPGKPWYGGTTGVVSYNGVKPLAGENVIFTPLCQVKSHRGDPGAAGGLWIVQVEVAAILSTVENMTEKSQSGEYKYSFTMRLKDIQGSSLLVAVDGTEGEKLFNGLPACDLRNPGNAAVKNLLVSNIATLMRVKPTTLLNLGLESIRADQGKIFFRVC